MRRSPLTAVKAKTDNLPSDPASETTVEAEAEVTHQHIHSAESWFGKSADQSGNNWGTVATLTPYRAISGDGDFGSDTDDEAKVLGSADTPVISGKQSFDLHRLLVDTVSEATTYVLWIIWGTGTMAEAIAAGQFSYVYIICDETKGKTAGGAPFPIQTLRLAAGTKFWIQCKNATDDATVDFFIGLHEYDQEA